MYCFALNTFRSICFGSAPLFFGNRNCTTPRAMPRVMESDIQNVNRTARVETLTVKRIRNQKRTPIAKTMNFF